jgi:ADP-ribose pyrophosphatase
MSVPDHDAPLETMWQGRFITAYTRGRWEYVGRARGIRAAVILAVEDGHVLLVEQYRVPLGRPCLELPAGLVGDEGNPDEAAETAAARELEEETGYRAATVEVVGEFFSSPGMVSESFTLVKATGLTRVSAGGGAGEENITVHRVALAAVPAFVEQRRAAGVAVDVKMLLLLAGDLLR